MAQTIHKLIGSLIYVQAIGTITPIVLVLAITGFLQEEGQDAATWVVTVASFATIVESIIVGLWGYKSYKVLVTEDHSEDHSDKK